MTFFDTNFKLASSALTVVWLFLTYIFSHTKSKLEDKKSLAMPHNQMIAQVAFILWTVVPYHQVIYLDDFKARIKQWAADTVAAQSEKNGCPNFDGSLWSKFSLRSFATTLFLMSTLYLIYSRLLEVSQRSMASQYELRKEKHILETHDEATVGLEIPIKRIVKKVKFQLPQPDRFSIVAKAHSTLHLILPNKRQIMLGSACLTISTLLLPKSFQHAFPMLFIRFRGYTVTSDHVVAALTLYIGAELVRTVFTALCSPNASCDVRLALGRFVQCYGIFLMIMAGLVLLQADDMLKIYVYKVFAPCENSRLSFVGARVPNGNILTSILGDGMMKYTNSNMGDALKHDQWAKTIDEMLNLFVPIFGDCVSVLLFASLVLVPSLLSYTCSI